MTLVSDACITVAAVGLFVDRVNKLSSGHIQFRRRVFFKILIVTNQILKHFTQVIRVSKHGFRVSAS